MLGSPARLAFPGTPQVTLGRELAQFLVELHVAPSLPCRSRQATFSVRDFGKLVLGVSWPFPLRSPF